MKPVVAVLGKALPTVPCSTPFIAGWLHHRDRPRWREHNIRHATNDDDKGHLTSHHDMKDDGHNRLRYRRPANGKQVGYYSVVFSSNLGTENES